MADKASYVKVYKNPIGENALHYRVVDHINETYPDVIIIPGLGEPNYIIHASRQQEKMIFIGAARHYIEI